MPIQLKSIYVGPNLYLPVAAVRWTYRSASQRPEPTLEEARALAAPLLGLLPTLRGRLERAPAGRRPTTTAELLMHTVMALQAAAGHPAEDAVTLPAAGGADIVCACKEAELCLVAMEAAVALLTALSGAEAPKQETLAAILRRFHAAVARRCLDPTARAVVQAAEARAIPWSRLVPRQPIVQLGYGRFARRLLGSTPDSQGVIAARHLARNRALTTAVLRAHGLPVPRQLPAANATAAAKAAERLGYPVVVKTAEAGRRRRTHAGLRDAAAVRDACARGFAPGETLVVEEQVAGTAHRLLVIGGRMIAAVDARNQDVTTPVHPDVRGMAERATQAIGLQVAVVLFITPDIAASFLKAGRICGIEGDPDLAAFRRAEGGARRDLGGPILDLLFPPGQPHHVPIAAVTGTNGKTTTCHMVAQILQQAGRQVGLVSTVGVRVNGAVIAEGDLAGAGGFAVVARNPAVDAIVAEVARGALIRRGTGFAACDAAAVLNVTTDHLGELGIESVEDMAGAKEVLARTATGTLVLNADDPLCLAMASRARAREICLVTMAEDCPALDAHLAAGGRGARLGRRAGREAMLLCGPEGEEEILASTALPAALGGLARHSLQNALFAAALARGLGVAVDDIRRALAAFHSDIATVPGRLNLFEGHPFKVILDYGHNPGAYRAMGPLVTALAAGRGRRICVFTSPADRNDAHLKELAAAAAPHFDLFICRKGVRRNREAGEITEKLRDALIAEGIAAENISTSDAPEAALRAGLGLAAPNDVLFVMSPPDAYRRFWQIIENFGKEPGA